MNPVPHQMFSLSTEGYTFYYRQDKYNTELKRCILLKNGVEVKNLRVGAYEERGNVLIAGLSHHDVINLFEAEISLGFY